MSVESFVEEMTRFHAGRRPSGLRRKYKRMYKEGPFVFFRGTNYLFAKAWPELRPQSPGPAVWLCGDLHLENFGAFPTDDGETRYDVNDFDEAVVAPCSIDLVRCATSILLAAESWRLKPTQGTGMVLTFLDSYRETVRDDARNHTPAEAAPDLAAVAGLIDPVAHGSSLGMLNHYAKPSRDGTWALKRQGSRMIPAGAKGEAAVRTALEAFGSASGWKVRAVSRRHSGVGSLGLRRYVVLVDETDSPDPLLLAVKETVPSVWQSIADPAQPPFADEGERAAEAQRILQAKPTARLAALAVAGRPCRIRAMIPDENRSSLNLLQEKPTKLRAAVGLAGRLTARMHWRGSRVGALDRSADLAAWADGPALESVLAAAVRFADWVNCDYATYVAAYKSGAFDD